VLSAADVTAVIVTRGDVDLTPIIGTLPYRTVVFDNSEWGADLKCYGRYAGAVLMAEPEQVIYFQDDDLIFSKHEELLAAYEPGKIVANMPSPWNELNGYAARDQVLVGAGSLCDNHLWAAAFDRYLSAYLFDDLFLTYCDQVFGMLAPSKRLDLGYQILPYAAGPDRIYTQPGADARRTEMINRALALREAP
jgi:hypothetical protein